MVSPENQDHATLTVLMDATDPSKPDYSGHGTFTHYLNFNKLNVSAGNTSPLILTGTDGSRLVANLILHITINATGEVTVDFEKPQLTCV